MVAYNINECFVAFYDFSKLAINSFPGTILAKSGAGLSQRIRQICARRHAGKQRFASAINWPRHNFGTMQFWRARKDIGGAVYNFYAGQLIGVKTSVNK